MAQFDNNQFPTGEPEHASREAQQESFFSPLPPLNVPNADAAPERAQAQPGTPSASQSPMQSVRQSAGQTESAQQRQQGGAGNGQYREPAAYPNSATARNMPAGKQKAPHRKSGAQSSQAYSGKKSQARKWLWISLTILLLCGIAAGAYLTVNGMRAGRYRSAQKLLSDGAYEAAAEAFDALGTYSDSAEKAKEARNEIRLLESYQSAKAFFDAGSYQEAAEAFEALGTYSDSAEKAQEAHRLLVLQQNEQAYQAALELFYSGSYQEAAEAFEALGTYSDSAENAQEIRRQLDLQQKEQAYQAAQALLDSGSYQEAAEAFEALGTYSDSAEKAAEARRLLNLRVLEVPAVKENIITANGVFVGETQTISEEKTVVFTGKLASDDAQDTYSYTAPRDGRYGFEFLNTRANERVRLMVFDSSDYKLLDTTSKTCCVDMKAGKTYTIRVYQSMGHPTYTLNLYVQKPVVDLSTTTTVYDQTAFEDQRNMYTFTAPVTGCYHFGLSEYKNGVGLRMLMWDRLGNNIMDSRAKSATVELNAGETYDFQIWQIVTSGSYELSIGFQKETVDLTGVTILYDSIEYADQKNVYTFTAPVSGRYHFGLSEYKNGVGFRMLMWDRLENNIMDSWSESATVVLNADETYTFQIRQRTGFYSYKLSIGSQKKAVDITGYDIIADAITFTDQVNTYYFTPSKTGEYALSLTDCSANCSFKLMAWDNYANKIMDTYNKSGTVTLESGITYELQVRQNTGFDSYKLCVEKKQ